MHVRPDDVVRRLVGARDAALDLRRRDALGQRRERLGRLVARLHLDGGPVDGRPVEPRRRAGLEPAERKAESRKRERKADGRRLTDAPGRDLALADVDQPAQKSAGGQHRGAAGQSAAVDQADARDTPLADDQIVRFAFDHGEIRGRADRALHRGRVKLAVGLGTGPTHRRPLAAIEHAELDAAFVRDAAHQAVECVDLAHQMALAEPADRRIAGHRPDGGESVRQQRSPRTHARSRSRGLAARVASADDDDSEVAHED